MALLQAHPIQAAGGIDHVSQTATDILQKHVEKTMMHKTEGLTLHARLKVSIWKGFRTPLMGMDGEGQETDSDDEETEVEDVHDDGNETETPVAESLTSRLATCGAVSQTRAQ